MFKESLKGQLIRTNQWQTRSVPRGQRWTEANRSAKCRCWTWPLSWAWWESNIVRVRSAGHTIRAWRWLPLRNHDVPWLKSYSTNRHILRVETNVRMCKNNIQFQIFYLINGILKSKCYVTLFVNAVWSSENVLICNENSTTNLIRLVTEESGHPRQIVFICRHSADDPCLFHELNATYIGHCCWCVKKP